MFSINLRESDLNGITPEMLANMLEGFASYYELNNTEEYIDMRLDILDEIESIEDAIKYLSSYIDIKITDDEYIPRFPFVEFHGDCIEEDTVLDSIDNIFSILRQTSIPPQILNKIRRSIENADNKKEELGKWFGMV